MLCVWYGRRYCSASRYFAALPLPLQGWQGLTRLSRSQQGGTVGVTSVRGRAGRSNPSYLLAEQLKGMAASGMKAYVGEQPASRYFCFLFLSSHVQPKGSSGCRLFPLHSTLSLLAPFRPSAAGSSRHPPMLPF
jgi:hypothetical protein